MLAILSSRFFSRESVEPSRLTRQAGLSLGRCCLNRSCFPPPWRRAARIASLSYVLQQGGVILAVVLGLFAIHATVAPAQCGDGLAGGAF